ncbi:CRISPR system precrRNA processing endoribonuclease RAMP protein Cas6 [Saccharolobus islandicus]|uniref:CRISPR system precrRNA processing endoribonuclease RAMP protein Cas6 n=1 Tax=Saccharolobus islandicus TaxID=43080 RepID=UPI00057FED77|nr:CRISPR system precrRNA processing endoribonuclease RAMP protein Cas6 [Sulfolobus islandicus]
MLALVKITYNVTPLTDVVLPSPSSKVLKYLILSGKLFPSLANLVKSRDKQKPLFISNLGYGDVRLISDGGEVIKVKANSRLKATLSFPFLDGIQNEITEGIYETPYGNFSFLLDSIEIIDIKSLKNVDDYQNANMYVKFLTPTLLSSKVLLPPSLASKYKQVNSGFSLLPSIGLIIAYAYRDYYAILGNTNGEEYASRAFKLGVLINAFTKIVGFNLRPKTVIIGRDSKNRLRETRGTVGWIEFDVVHDKFKRLAIKYLLIASYLGLGRSRGIGLGEIKFELKRRKE